MDWRSQSAHRPMHAEPLCSSTPPACTSGDLKPYECLLPLWVQVDIAYLPRYTHAAFVRAAAAFYHVQYEVALPTILHAFKVSGVAPHRPLSCRGGCCVKLPWQSVLPFDMCVHRVDLEVAHTRGIPERLKGVQCTINSSSPVSGVLGKSAKIARRQIHRHHDALRLLPLRTRTHATNMNTVRGKDDARRPATTTWHPFSRGVRTPAHKSSSNAVDERVSNE